MQTTLDTFALYTTPLRRTTTLYELIAALHTVIPPEDDAQVVAAVMHWLHSGQITLGTYRNSSDHSPSRGGR